MPFVPIIKNLKNIGSTERVEVIEHILSMFQKCLHNNIIVNDPMNNDKYQLDLVKLTLGAYFSDYSQQDQKTRKVLLKFIKAITVGGRFCKLHFELIYNYIARNPKDLLGTLELLENMICVDTTHIPMFYFSDYDSYIEINPLLTIEKAFANGFGIMMWFRLEFLNNHCSTNELPLLFSIFCNRQGGFEAFFEGNTLFYRTLGSKKYKNPLDDIAEEIYTFEAEKWYSLFINHSK